MADIDVERKGPSIWPWIIGLLVLAVLIWALVEMFGADEPDVTGMVEDTIGAPMPGPAAPVGVAATLPAAVQSYLTECTAQGGEPTGDMGVEHDYTIRCLRQLQAGLNALASQEQVASADVSARLGQLTTSVQQLEASDASSTAHANLTRDAAGTAVDLLESMQAAWYSGQADMESAVDEAEDAAEGIRDGVPMLDQRDAVRAFFREAGDALRAMAEMQPGAGTGM